MSADLLRRAAKVLREHAGKAQHKQDWCADYLWAAIRHVQRNCGDDLECGAHGSDPDAECGQPDMYDGRYVALMHPPVALALAGVLDRFAADANEADPALCPCLEVDAWHDLANLARAILREVTE